MVLGAMEDAEPGGGGTRMSGQMAAEGLSEDTQIRAMAGS